MKYRAWNERGRIGGECIASWLLSPLTQHVEGMILEHLWSPDRWQEGCAWRTPEDHSRRDITRDDLPVYLRPSGRRTEADTHSGAAAGAS